MVMSVACGFFYGVEEKLYLRTEKYRCYSENVLIEKETASLISRSSARFWPLLL